MQAHKISKKEFEKLLKIYESDKGKAYLFPIELLPFIKQIYKQNNNE